MASVIFHFNFYFHFIIKRFFFLLENKKEIIIIYFQFNEKENNFAFYFRFSFNVVLTNGSCRPPAHLSVVG